MFFALPGLEEVCRKEINLAVIQKPSKRCKNNTFPAKELCAAKCQKRNHPSGTLEFHWNLWEPIGIPCVSRGRSVTGRLTACREPCRHSEILRLTENDRKPLGLLMFFTCRIKGAPAELEVAPRYPATELKTITLWLTGNRSKTLGFQYVFADRDKISRSNLK